MIYLFTGPIRSHKTTTLLQWAQLRMDCGGVLSPDVQGMRHLYNVRDKIYLSWQKTEREKDTDVVIGRFIFDQDAFDTAVGWLNDHLEDPSLQFIILDEVGPLELSGKGWNFWLRNVLLSLGDTSLILVVRESLLEDVITAYALIDYKVVGREYFV